MPVLLDARVRPDAARHRAGGERRHRRRPGGPGSGELSALVIGYGNALRRDDAVGLHVARAVAARATGISVLQRAMLVPELAEPVARADLVVFVDAQPGGAVAALSLDLLDPLEPASLSHVTDPRALLALAAQLFGRRPPAWIVTVPAFDLAVGEGLSAATAGAVDEATEAVLRLLRAPAGQHDAG